MKRVIVWALIGGVIAALIARSLAQNQPLDLSAVGVRTLDQAVARWEAMAQQWAGIGFAIGAAAGGLFGYWLQRSKDPEWRLICAWKDPQIYESDDPPAPPLLKP